MMYFEGQSMASKVFGRTLEPGEKRFNIYVLDPDGNVTKLLPDEPLKLRISTREVLQTLKERGYANIIFFDASCQNFKEVTALKRLKRQTEMEPTRRALAEKYASNFYLGGGYVYGAQNGALGVRSIE